MIIFLEFDTVLALFEDLILLKFFERIFIFKFVHYCPMSSSRYFDIKPIVISLKLS